MVKKLFVVSDIHGHYSPLKEALDRSGFDKADREHLLICCGDYFDKGDENVQVLEFFEGLERKVLLRGNHEDLLLKLLTTGQMHPHQFINGTENTLKNFFGAFEPDPVDHRVDFSGQAHTVEKLCRFIRSTVNYYETERYVFVHGWLPEKGETPEGRSAATAQDWEKARCASWVRHYKDQPPLPDKTLVCGHIPTFCAEELNITPDTEGDTIFYGKGLMAIDAGTMDSKKVNVLVLEEQV